MNNNLKLYIVRHGQTEWNVLKKFQGQLNSPLTLEGIEKIKETSIELENIKFEAVYTSELGRTISTAEIILQYNNSERIKDTNKKLKPQKLSELNEIYFGEWQGMNFKEIFLKYPKEAHNYFYEVKNYNAKNIKAEELKDGLERFLKGINKIVNKHKSGNILIVTHGTVLELFLNYIQNKEAKNLDERKLIGNGQYRIFTFENEKYKIL
ncbi:histidine phosphatase family protein [Leptotrichia sp. oral taxon 879]|uniref:histidine phosphatase family protein n=1 Tax=Leptotrichia sp. oral taxon 879 TaxID=1227267 RepID=UPI0003ADDEC6|nr:histidine phosphatase family protein [Leptotrichia sp. oral taxon 879]ERK55044.1 phosphoglycerate mutase family protein [Leptotrichia sp. oral taxon 879 str. F0557]